MGVTSSLFSYQHISTYMYMGIPGTGALKDEREGIVGNL